ncbi:MAG: ABC transporter ATP-binding protein [Nocardioidaceae bacterium]
MNRDLALQLTDVTLTYPDGAGRVTALDDVSLAVPRGHVTAVVGPSGSGKSSLLAVAATLIRPDLGAVVVDGIDTTEMTGKELSALRRERIGIVFQQPNLLPALTAAEQVEVMGHLGGRGRARRIDARDVLAEVGMADLADRRPAQLSGGQRQRVNIARALVLEPAVMLVDEPTSALDHVRGAEVMALLRRLTTERNTATVLVTHDTELLAGAERIVECRDGRLDGAPAVLHTIPV